LEESYCIGNAVDSVKIEDTWYSFPKLDFHRNVRPHPIDSYPDIGASESSFAQNPLPDNTPVLTTRNIVMQVYPNPFEDLITLRLHEDGSYRIKILSLTGQLIKCEEFKGNDHQVDLVGIPSGIYIISISSEEFRSIKKVMKL